MSYPRLDVQLEGGKELLLNEVVTAMTEARNLIQVIGTTGAERTDVIRKAEDWMKKYYPAWA